MNYELAGGDPFAGIKKAIEEDRINTQHNEGVYNEEGILENEPVWPFIIGLFLIGLIMSLFLSTLHFKSEAEARERTINILKADIERLKHSSHNPFVHAR